MLHKEYRKQCKDLLPNKWCSFVFSTGHCPSKIYHTTKIWESHWETIKSLGKALMWKRKGNNLNCLYRKEWDGNMTNVCKILSGIQKALRSFFSSSHIMHKERDSLRCWKTSNLKLKRDFFFNILCN